jgi:hemerythrin
MSPEAFKLYKVGIKYIDEEHWEILNLINLIDDDVKTKKHTEALQAVSTLREKLLAHYASEEEMMERISFPYIEYHKNAHKDILKELQRIESFFHVNHEASKDCAKFLHSLTVAHLDHMDRQYIKYWEEWEKRAFAT